MPLILPGNVASATASTSYDVANSCRFNRADGPNMTKTPGSSGDLRKWTWSCWVKRGSISNGSQTMFNAGSSSNNQLRFDSDDTINFYQWNGSAYTARLATNQVFLDCSAWYHIVAHWDTDNGTAGDRMKLYVNGTEVTSFKTDTNPDQNLDSIFGVSGTALFVGDKGDGAEEMDGYLAEMCFIDGQNLAPSSFGEFDSDSPNIWKPIDVSGLSFGTNGFYLDFEASGNLGNDANGGTDFTENNIAATDQTTDTPTNNFAVWDPLTNRDTANGTWTEGNLRVLASGGDMSRYCTLPIPLNFKFYFEVKAPIVGAQAGCGVTTTHDTNGARNKVGENNGYGWKFRGAASVVQYFNNGTASNHATNNPSDNSIMGFAVDCANGRMHMHIDGTYLDSSDPTDNDPNSVVTGFSTTVIQYLHMSLDTRSASQPIMEFNFGNPVFSISSGNTDANGYGNFEFAVPSGYLAFCTKNMADF